MSGRGARQGCPLCSLLFNIYAEEMVRQALDAVNECVRVDGHRLQAVTATANDQAMVAITEEGLHTAHNDGAKRYSGKV